MSGESSEVVHSLGSLMNGVEWFIVAWYGLLVRGMDGFIMDWSICEWEEVFHNTPDLW